jgi:hypothetical protein
MVHDLNLPVSEELHERFDTIIDGGTLEHVFNFPQAIKSAMEMLAARGRLFIIAPGNNYFGHGFYQFSPELFYRVLSRDNGFHIERMLALVDDGGFSRILGRPYFFRLNGPWYAVEDPDVIGKRVTLMNELPVTLFIEARRVAIQPIFHRHPQQSDYSAQWAARQSSKSGQLDEADGGTGFNQRWLERVPTWARWKVLPSVLWLLDPLRLMRWKRHNSFRNREFFRRTTGAERRRIT